MFKSNQHLLNRIKELENEVLLLEERLELKDTQIEFYKQRGEKYFVSLDKRHQESQELLSLAKELLKHSAGINK